ncbi:MAG: ATP-binding protein [Anaerolineae bacterium]
MTDTRQYIADVLFTAAILGVGLLSGNPILASVVAGIGVNLASDLTRAGWGQVCHRLLGESGLRNYDLQQAMLRAFRQAITHLEQAWWQTPRGRQMRRDDPEVARVTSAAFRQLEEDACTFCFPDHLGRVAGNDQVHALLYGDAASAHAACSVQLANYLHGHDTQLVAFIEKHLIGELAFWFGEELKADRPESNRAWRAFQRLLLEGLQTALTDMRAEQQEMRQALDGVREDLHAWAGRMEALPQESRESTGESALANVLTEARDQLLAAIATESGLTRTAVETGVEQIARLLREELARLRHDMLPRLGERGLTEGQTPLQADLRRHFDGLLRDYALFGGRADEFATVNAFLADPQGGYLFLTGSSGYGKTALLVQLARQGEAAYHFLNRTYGTADEDLFLRNLCQQLAARHGLGGRLPASTAELRALYPDLLRLPPADGRPVVVLLDGLDEAVNWEPSLLHFPPDLPDGVKVIFSARQVAERDWPNRLRLPTERVQRLTLGALTADDVRSLLRAAGGIATPLADDPGWIAQVLRVSAGDPFYVKLLVEDIRDGRMRPEQIGGQPAGLDAYLKGWWEQVAAAVRAQDVRDLLGSLAVARGLLGRDDLIAMFPKLGWALDGVLTEVRRFAIGGEQQGYALCHPRFADYVRRRVGPRAVQTYTDALLAYCVSWHEHRSPYAFRYATAHLLEAERWQELLDLVDKPFLRAKVQRLRSYSGALEDLRNGVQAARAVHDSAKMLGLALAHAGLQAKVVQLAAYDVIPLYARFGEPERALELADTIADETQRAKTLVAVARELLPSEPDRARQIVRQVLANWRRYPEGNDCGAILREALTVLPDELIDFLESLDEFSPLGSLGSWPAPPAYKAVDEVAPKLEPAQQERLRVALRNALRLTTEESDKWPLQLLLVRLEPDPEDAAIFAHGDTAHIIIQAKRDARAHPTQRLNDQTVAQVVRLFVDRTQNPGFFSRWTLLYTLVAPHIAQFLDATRGLEASPLLVWFLLEAGLTVMERGDTEAAQALLDEAIRVDQTLQNDRLIRQGGGPETLRLLIRLIGAAVARENLETAVGFLGQPQIDDMLGSDRGRAMADVLGAASERNPLAALRETEGAWLYRDGVRAAIAENIARTDLNKALAIWDELDSRRVDKSSALIKILYAASPAARPVAQDVLENSFQPDLRYQLYKVPVQLEIALRLRNHQPEQARALGREVLRNLRARFDAEHWDRAQREFFLLRIISAVSKLHLFAEAVNLVTSITDDYFLEPIAVHKVLCALVDDLATSGTSREDLFLQLPEHARQRGGDVWPNWVGSGAVRYMGHLLSRFLVDKPSGLEHGPFDETRTLAEYLVVTRAAPVTGLYLYQNASKGWGPDQVRAVLTAEAVTGSTAAACVGAMRNAELQEVALVESCRFPPISLSQLSSISNRPLRAIGFLRAASLEAQAILQRDLVQRAFIAARQGLKYPTEIATQLLVEFVREAYSMDAEATRQFASEMIASTLASERGHVVHWMFELEACGYTFSVDERAALEELSERWVIWRDQMQDCIGAPPIREQDAHQRASRYLAQVARSTLPVNRERGLRIVSMASRHADMVTDVTQKMRLRRDILKSMLVVGDTTLWEEALARSLDFEETIFHVFDWFGQSALKLQREDKTFPPRLLDVIDWAEQLMRV